MPHTCNQQRVLNALKQIVVAESTPEYKAARELHSHFVATYLDVEDI